MKKTTRSFLSMCLVLVMLAGSFAACKKEEESTNGETDTKLEDTTVGSGTESGSVDETADTEETETDVVGPMLEGIANGENIENAYALSNGVDAYFTDGKRTDFVLENQNMTLEYALASYKKQQVTALSNKQGGVYLANTSDVYVKTTDGFVFYASDSSRAATANLYRLGFYYYEARFEEQLFNGTVDAKAENALTLSNVGRNQVRTTEGSDGSLQVLLTDTSDPYITFKNVNVNAADYNYVRVTLRADSDKMHSLCFYIKAGSATGFSDNQSKYITISPSEDYVTYYVPLSAVNDYTGKVTGLRLDFSGSKGMTYNVKEVAFIKADEKNPPMDLGLNRSFLIYSDKLHHYLQVASNKVDTANIAEVGLETKIPADTVAKLVIKDKNGTHDSLDGVDFNTAEYVGFDIKDAGIFGYILPADNKGGKLTVTLSDGVYTIIQSRAPENNTIKASGTGEKPVQISDDRDIYPIYADPTNPNNKTVLVENNANDFFMGQRLYTDETHDFATFLKEAELERNPLSEKNITVDADNSTGASFLGYDALRGIYTFHLEGDGFNGPYFSYPNKHYNVKFTIKGDDKDRKIYIMTLTDEGCLECAVLLNEKDMMLPLPIQVGKNFSEAAGERNLWNIQDKTYGEAILPMVIQANSTQSYNFLNLYQNWGKYPLKQISWIQFYAPYYHLSTGVTETNCIVPHYSCKNARGLATLPDHRAMSAPLWAGQPQHTSGGSHRWLCYTDADGNYIASELSTDSIDSYGPIYADYTMNYLTDDGKISVSYTHTEFPQTDENRAFYEMQYEVLEDVSIKDFAHKFHFLRLTDNDSTGVYQSIGYLNEKNESVVVSSVAAGESKKYVLGDKCPYFSFFNMKDYSCADGYVNLSFLIYNSEFVIGGKKVTPKFVIVNDMEDGSNSVRISLDLGDVTLKAGDTFSINAIVMPWGSQVSEYKAGNEDKNVRDVRTDSLLNPLTLTPGANTEKIESVFLPKAKSKDGKSAEFTITGGQNNVAVRIYGFKTLTAPIVEEYVNGEWVAYNLNSAYTPDRQGNAHYYDGYSVFYDLDGTFSYAFIVEQDHTDKDGRKFRITAAEDFKGWPEKLPEIDNGTDDLPLDAYVPAKDLADFAGVTGLFNATELKENESYVTLSSAGRLESYFNAYVGNGSPTGQYFVIKYRVPETNADKMTFLEVFASTVNSSATGDDCFYLGQGFTADGQWQVMVVDLASWQKKTFAPDENGSYTANFVRLDIFNEKFPADNRFDLAYIGLSDNLDDIYKLCADMDYISYVSRDSGSTVATRISPKTGEEVK